MSTSWLVPSSSLSRVSLNGLSAGALRVLTLNLTPDATTATPPGAPAPVAPDGGGADPPAPPAPPLPPAADRGGNQPALSATAATISSANTDRTVLGHAGGGSFSRCPVTSARTTCRYSFRASFSQ